MPQSRSNIRMSQSSPYIPSSDPNIPQSYSNIPQSIPDITTSNPNCSERNPGKPPNGEETCSRRFSSTVRYRGKSIGNSLKIRQIFSSHPTIFQGLSFTFKGIYKTYHFSEFWPKNKPQNMQFLKKMFTHFMTSSLRRNAKFRNLF